MTANLLLTKLYRPAVPLKIVQRPFLSQRLDEGLEAGRKLTLVSAPAGFGKTTCISEWADTLQYPVAWLSLDAEDDDPGRFFTYLVAALNKVDENLGQEIEAVLRAGQLPPAEIISAVLINDILAMDGRFLLVLDDFQLIQDEFILQVLRTMVTNLPQALHFVLLSREEPSLPLARLRANNQMTEIRAADLRLTSQETAVFLNEVMGLALAPADIAALEDKSEGWIAGLQLAGLSIRDRANPSEFISDLSGSHRHFLSYLTEEVVNQQPAEIQNFLLQTSILDKLNGDLCDAVTGGENGRFLLEQLYYDNLFLIPLDDEQQWYRYHQLFAGLLRHRQETLHKEESAALHRRASRWYEQAGLSSEAVQHAIEAADYETAVSLIETHAMDMLMAWHARTVRGWMHAIPPEWAAKSPKTNLAFAWMHLFSNNFAQALPYIERLQVMFADAQLDEDDPALQAEWLALQATLLNGQGLSEQSLALSNQALAIVPKEDAYIRGLIYGGLASSYKQMNDYPQAVAAYEKLIQHGRIAGSLFSELMGISALGLYAMERGDLHYAFEIALQGVERLERSGTLPPIGAAVYGELGGVAYHWYQIEKTHHYLTRSTQVSTLSGYSDAEIYHHVVRSRLAQIEEDLETALLEINKAVELTQVDAPAAIREEVIAQQVRMALLQNKPAAAEALLNPRGYIFQGKLSWPAFESGQVISRSTGLLLISALRVILYQGQNEGLLANLGQGIELADTLIVEARKSEAIPILLETLLVRAQMQTALGDDQFSRADVATAVELAEPEGFITIFLEEGRPVARILASLLANNQLESTQADHAAEILAAYPEAVQAAALSAPEIAPTREMLIEPLSKRELEILRLIGEGCTNQEIAGRLVITLHTVKKHSSNIYGKLGVRSRTQAVARARELQLL
jgi:LuxR family maltose regulon positive regulatory protein